MALARFLVIEGPDAGREFELPLRGGGVGRGDGNLVVLTDLSVSRQHGVIELRDGALWWIDDSGKPRTLINGKPAIAHRLDAGDEIVLGATRMTYLAVDGVAITKTSSRVTMEVSSERLLALTARDDRAHRHLAAIAQLGERLRSEVSAGREAIARATCDAARIALEADRAFVLATGARLTPIAAAVGVGEAAQLQLPQELVDKIIGQRQVINAETAGRTVIAAPIVGVDHAITGVVWIDRRSTGWNDSDALAIGCIALLAGAAWVGADARAQLQRRAEALEDQIEGGAQPVEFVGRSAAAHRVIDFVRRVGPSDATILLGGESGAGKEMVARAIHRASRRAKGPCVAVNCAALTESLIESELFGHEKGAFTGATEKKAGRFEMADGGTLFLDEVGELPLALQTKFLRVLEERRFERVGGQKAIEVDVRVVAATNRDLSEMVRRGQFREDLFYRLSVITIDVPPLRERLDDVPLLADYFLTRFKSQGARRITGFSEGALAAMVRYGWPGNVRELRNAVERAIVLGERDTIQPEDLPPQVLGSAALPRSTAVAAPTPPLGSSMTQTLTSPPRAVAPSPSPAAPLPSVTIDEPPPARARSLRELEKDGILAALAATGGNKAQAAAILEIDRSTLYKKLKDYGIDS